MESITLFPDVVLAILVFGNLLMGYFWASNRKGVAAKAVSVGHIIISIAFLIILAGN